MDKIVFNCMSSSYLKLDYLENKVMINVLLGQIGVEVRRFNEPKEKLVYNLKVRPSKFQYRFVLLWIKGLACWVHLGWYCSEEVRCKLENAGSSIDERWVRSTFFQQNTFVVILYVMSAVAIPC